MSKSKLGISSFDLNVKFKDRNEAYKYAKRLKEFIRYMCKKNANKGWSAGAMICVSNIKGNSSYVYYKRNGKVGRPSKVREKHLFENNIEVKWHLHILLVSKPLYAFRDEIKKYIDKKWVEVEKEENIDNILSSIGIEEIEDMKADSDYLDGFEGEGSKGYRIKTDFSDNVILYLDSDGNVICIRYADEDYYRKGNILKEFK